MSGEEDLFQIERLTYAAAYISNEAFKKYVQKNIVNFESLPPSSTHILIWFLFTRPSLLLCLLQSCFTIPLQSHLSPLTPTSFAGPNELDPP